MGKETLHDVSALGDETRIGFGRSKKLKKRVIWHPHGRPLLVALSSASIFSIVVAKAQRCACPDAVLRCAPAGNAFLAAIFASRAAAAV